MPMRTTINSYTNKPMMMDGADNSTSLMKRITGSSQRSAHIRPVGAGQHPIGEPINMPSSVITALPYKAFSKPPWLPGAAHLGE